MNHATSNIQNTDDIRRGSRATSRTNTKCRKPHKIAEGNYPRLARRRCGRRNTSTTRTTVSRMKLVVDSAVFVAAFREEEPYSKEAFRLLERLQKGTHTVYLPVIVPIEVVAAIRRRTGNADFAQKVGEVLLALPDMILIDLTTFRMARYLGFAGESGLSGMDSVIVGVAQEFGVPLVTLDKEIIEKGRRFVDIVEIDEF